TLSDSPEIWRWLRAGRKHVGRVSRPEYKREGRAEHRTPHKRPRYQKPEFLCLAGAHALATTGQPAQARQAGESQDDPSRSRHSGGGKHCVAEQVDSGARAQSQSETLGQRVRPAQAAERKILIVLEVTLGNDNGGVLRTGCVPPCAILAVV